MRKKINNILRKKGINLTEIINTEINNIGKINTDDYNIVYDKAFDILEDIDDGYSLADVDDLLGLGENERWFDYLLEDVMLLIINRYQITD